MKRGMTAESAATTSLQTHPRIAPNTPRHSRGLFRPGGCPSSRPPEIGGCRERRVPVAPAARVRKKCTRWSPQVLRISRRSLRNGFNGLCRALPGDEFVLSPSPTNWRRAAPGWASRASAGLTPATGARTTRFCRPRPPPSAPRRAMCRPAEIHEGGFIAGRPREGFAHGISALQQPARARRSRVHRIHPALVTIATRPSVGCVLRG